MITIQAFTKDKIHDVIEFENELRRQEPNTYFWNIDSDYEIALINSFDNPRFINSVSLLAYDDTKVIGRIDASLLCSRDDPAYSSAYLDWICVLKSERHKKVAQSLLSVLRSKLKEMGIDLLIALMAHNEEAVRFYRSIQNAEIHDEGVWITV